MEGLARWSSRLALISLAIFGPILSARAEEPRTDRFGSPLPAGAAARVGLPGNSDANASCVAFAPDGKTFAWGCGTAIHVWDTASQREVALVRKHESAVFALTFSRDGKLLASGGFDRTVRLFEVATWKELRSFAPPAAENAAPTSVTFSPDGKTLATAWAGVSVRLLSVETFEVSRVLPSRSVGYAPLAFLNDGKTLVAPNGDAASLWDTASGALLRNLENGEKPVTALALSPDGKTVALASGTEGGLRVLDVATGAARPAPKVGRVASLSFSPDGSRLACGSGTTITLYDVEGRAVRTFSDPDGPWQEDVGGLAFAPDGKLLLAAGGVRIFDVATGRSVLRPARPDGAPRALAFSGDGKTLAVEHGRRISVCEVATDTLLAVLKGHERDVTAVALSRDGRTLASCSEDGTTRVWDVALAREVRKIKDAGRAPTSVALSPDDKLVATGNQEGAIHVFALATGRELLSLRAEKAARGGGVLAFDGGAEGVVALAFSADSKTLTSVDSAGTISVFRAAKGDLAGQLSWSDYAGGREAQVSCSAIAGKLVAVATAEATLVVSLERGKAVIELAEGSQAVALSPDGKALARTRSQGKGLELRDTSRQVPEARTLLPKESAVLGLAFSPGGQLASAGGDFAILLWEAGPKAQAFTQK